LSLLTSKNVGGRRYAVSTGYSQGYVVKHDLIQRFCEKLALRLGSRGPLNIQLRMSEGVPFVFELHPRFSGTTPIRADVGFNEVDILLRNYLFGEKFSRLDYKYNVAAIRAFEHVIVPIEQMKR
jgi:carbamoyl-phosphate synthase large subunit